MPLATTWLCGGCVGVLGLKWYKYDGGRLGLCMFMAVGFLDDVHDLEWFPEEEKLWLLLGCVGGCVSVLGLKWYKHDAEVKAWFWVFLAAKG